MADDSLTRLASPVYDSARRASYVALDVGTREQAEAWIQLFGDVVDGYKIGLELFCREGPAFVESVVGRGKRVFLDVKLHDIPNTVAGALRSVRDLGIELVTVHASGGRRMLEAARAAVGDSSDRPRIVAVTALTSLSDEALSEIGVPESRPWVTTLAQLAFDCGLDGVVASAHDVADVYNFAPRSFWTVVPGTRPHGSPQHDQARSLTPGEAVRRGATHLVLGRAVTAAPRPVDALRAIWDEMRAAADSAGG